MEDFDFRERNLYSKEGRQEAIESGAISAEDEGFMAGFDEEPAEESPKESYEEEWDKKQEEDCEEE